MNANEIDAVITWVDETDPVYKAKFETYLAGSEDTQVTMASPKKGDDICDVVDCVKSILKVAPWICKIHIVTDSEESKVMENLKNASLAERVRVVTHKEIFEGFENFLPIFNHNTVTLFLWKIKNLSNQFIFFKDNVTLANPVTCEDFFRDNSIVLKGEWRKFTDQSMMKKLRHHLYCFLGKIKIITYDESIKENIAQQKSARLSGTKEKYYHLLPAPIPMQVSSLRGLFEENPSLFKDALLQRFSSPDEFMIECVYSHYELKKGRVTELN